MVRALLVIDAQLFVSDRVNSGVGYYPSGAVEEMAAILQKYREEGGLVVHVVHESQEPGQALHRSSPLYPMIPSMQSICGEAVFVKNTSSAFTSTDLEKYLRKNKVTRVLAVGAVAGFCVNTTVRHGCDLGFEMEVAEKAICSFDLGSLDAKTIHGVTVGLLGADFATIV